MCVDAVLSAYPSGVRCGIFCTPLGPSVLALLRLRTRCFYWAEPAALALESSEVDPADAEDPADAPELPVAEAEPDAPADAEPEAPALCDAPAEAEADAEAPADSFSVDVSLPV